jgi:leucyl aminopeptidase
MEIKISQSPMGEIAADCIAVVVLDHNTDKAKNAKATVKISNSDRTLLDAAAHVLASGDVSTKSMDMVQIHAPKGMLAKRLLLIGGEKVGKLNAVTLRKAAGTAVRAMKSKELTSLAFVFPENAGTNTAEFAVAITEGAILGDFDPNYYHSDKSDLSLKSFTLVIDAKTDAAAVKKGMDYGRIVGESQNFTRDLVNEPGNKMTPTIMGERAKKMAAEVGLKCEVWSTEKMKELKMGAFLSVSQGSAEPPALIVLDYTPSGAPLEPCIGLVGKGITFDTGGISIKPSEGMEKMKYDMAGGGAMLGAMRAIALLKPNVRVKAIVCASENMPDGKAQKPGDVQFAMNGKSIEIINTDAEGRLVLADGLCYARQLGCTHLIDAATLTGACVVALGMVHAGVFSNDADMTSRFMAAHKAAGENFWQLPLDEEYFDMIRSNIADIVNSGGRWGGAVTAAKFLQEFVDDKPWIHLDIAGVAWTEESKPWTPKGPSGIAVRSLVKFVEGFAK